MITYTINIGGGWRRNPQTVSLGAHRCKSIKMFLTMKFAHMLHLVSLEIILELHTYSSMCYAGQNPEMIIFNLLRAQAHHLLEGVRENKHTRENGL